MSAVVTAGAARLDIGKVISDTFAVARKNFGPFFLIALVCGGLPKLIAAMMVLGNRDPSLTTAINGLLAMVFLAPTLIMTGGLYYATERDLMGHKAPVGDLIKVGARHCFSLFGLSILAGVGAALGFLLLVVPGVLLMLAWSVAGPVLINEGRGIKGSFARSLELTRGRRGAIFLLMVILFAIGFGLQLVVGVVGSGATMVNALRGASIAHTTAPGAVFAALLLNPLVSAVIAMFAPIVLATLYHHLRAGRGGAPVEALAEVFA